MSFGNTGKTNTENTGHSLQHTAEQLLQRMIYMETSIKDLQIRQIQNRPGTLPSESYNAKGYDHISLYASADQELNGEGNISSVEESETNGAEIKHSERPSQINETGNQSVVAHPNSWEQVASSSGSKKRNLPAEQREWRGR